MYPSKFALHGSTTAVLESGAVGSGPVVFKLYLSVSFGEGQKKTRLLELSNFFTDF